MPTYLMAIAYRGAEGRVDTHVVVSDTYPGLLSTPTVVSGILVIGTSSKDLEISVGQQAADEFSFELDELAIETADDLACAEFILEAQGSSTDPLLKRYIAVLLQPSDPIEPEDFEFRGMIEPEMSATAYDWNGPEFDSDPAPMRRWKCTATSLEVKEIIDKKLLGDDAEPGLFDLIDTEWRDENVADMLGFFYEEDGPYGKRDGRYGDMVAFHSLIQKLLDLASDGTGVTVTFTPDTTDFEVWPARVRLLNNGTEEVDFAQTRYGLFNRRFVELDDEGNPIPYPYFVDEGDLSYKLQLTAPDPLGVSVKKLFVSWKVIRPADKDAEAYAWGAADTLSNLIYGLAFNLGMLVVWEYVDNDSITLRFRSRRNLSTTSPVIYIPDVTSESLDVKPSENAEKGRFGGFANHMCEEGLNKTFRHDGGFVKSPGFKDVTGDPLLLTISPTICWIDHMGEDAGFKPGERFDMMGVNMLYNAIFYDWTTVAQPSVRALNGSIDADMTGLHTAMYIQYFGTGINEVRNGTEGQNVVRPIGAITIKKNGNLVWFATMSEYLEYLYSVDVEGFESEMELQVPYLTRFRNDPTGDEDWRYCTLAARVTLDEREWTIVGLERDFVQGTTKLRLHNISRFAFDDVNETATSPALGLPIVSSIGTSNLAETHPPIVQSFPAGDVIDKYAAVFTWTDGKIYQASPDSYAYGRITGISLAEIDEDALAIGALCPIQTDGPLHLDDDYEGLTPGAPLLLRQTGHADAALTNLSTVPRRDPTDDEYLHYPLGTVQTPRIITINIGKPVFLKEDVLQVDLSGGYEV